MCVQMQQVFWFQKLFFQVDSPWVKIKGLTLMPFKCFVISLSADAKYIQNYHIVSGVVVFFYYF